MSPTQVIQDALAPWTLIVALFVAAGVQVTEASVPLVLTRARISNAMPGLEAVPVTFRVESSKQETFGVGNPGSVSMEYA